MRDRVGVGRLLAALCLVTAGMVGLAGPSSSSVRIVGGERASITSYPFAVYLATTDGFQFCGGTLAAPDKVVTAAHCAGGQQPADIKVVAGREDKQSTTTGISVDVTKIWVHPKYTDALAGADVAVLSLAKRLPYKPIPIAAGQDNALYHAGTQSTILGWGRTSSGGQSSRYLLKATVPVLDDTSCGTAFSKYNPDAMVCAGYANGGIDACQGDSGGPMVAGGKLVGISSWGEGCALPNKPGVYTRVAAYAKDITRQITPPVVNP
jgi:trypsin